MTKELILPNGHLELSTICEKILQITWKRLQSALNDL